MLKAPFEPVFWLFQVDEDGALSRGGANFSIIFLVETVRFVKKRDLFGGSHQPFRDAVI